MNMKTTTQNAYLGYFASLLPALVIAVAGSSFVTSVVMVKLGMTGSPHLDERLTAAIFLGLCFANPVGVWMRDSSIRAMVLRCFAGMIAGVLIYQTALLPLAGEGLARFALLFTGVIGLPVLMLNDWVAERFAKAPVATQTKSRA